MLPRHLKDNLRVQKRREENLVTIPTRLVGTVTTIGKSLKLDNFFFQSLRFPKTGRGYSLITYVLFDDPK